MNLYIRYFDEECVVSNVSEAYEFLSSIPGIVLDEFFLNDLKQYMESPMPYPKRYKVRPRVYFIVIKTTAKDLAEFKANGGRSAANVSDGIAKEMPVNRLMEEKIGWYEGMLSFKRVIAIPGTNKFQYKDTYFTARVKAHSPIDCYNRIIEHLRDRQDVDPRSQFPSAKGKNFKFQYLGMTLLEDTMVQQA